MAEDLHKNVGQLLGVVLAGCPGRAEADSLRGALETAAFEYRADVPAEVYDRLQDYHLATVHGSEVDEKGRAQAVQELCKLDFVRALCPVHVLLAVTRELVSSKKLNKESVRILLGLPWVDAIRLESGLSRRLEDMLLEIECVSHEAEEGYIEGHRFEWLADLLRVFVDDISKYLCRRYTAGCTAR